jgi:hypothetical protein
MNNFYRSRNKKIRKYTFFKWLCQVLFFNSFDYSIIDDSNSGIRGSFILAFLLDQNHLLHRREPSRRDVVEVHP